MKLKTAIQVLAMAWFGSDGARGQGLVELLRLVPCPASASHQIPLVPATTTDTRQAIQCYKLTGAAWKVDTTAKTVEVNTAPVQGMLIKIEIPVGTVNGINRDFNLTNIPTGPLNVRVHVSALTLHPGVHFTVTVGPSSAVIRFVTDPPMTGESFWAEVF